MAPIWLPITFFDFLWVQYDFLWPLYGFLWLHMGTYGSNMASYDLLWPQYNFLWVPTAPIWLQMGSYDFNFDANDFLWRHIAIESKWDFLMCLDWAKKNILSSNMGMLSMYILFQPSGTIFQPSGSWKYFFQPSGNFFQPDRYTFFGPTWLMQSFSSIREGQRKSRKKHQG